MLNNRIKKVLNNPYVFIPYLGAKGLLNWLPDKLYLQGYFRSKMNYKIDFKNPKTYNEKLQWLKLHDRNPKYTQMVDKYAVRKFVTKRIGKEYLIPILGVYNTFEEIDFNDLPNQFVLKCNHDSGGIVICKDKSKFDIKSAKYKINKSLNTNYYYFGREWPYKNIEPKIICEKYMVDESGYELKDYKLFCFDGKPKALFVASERETNTKFDFFDMNFNRLPLQQGYNNSNKRINKPEGFEEMITLSKKMSKGIPHVRVDFYEINGKVYFGEMTFYHFSGFVKFVPSEYDEVFGRWLSLPPKTLYSNHNKGLDD